MSSLYVHCKNLASQKKCCFSLNHYLFDKVLLLLDWSTSGMSSWNIPSRPSSGWCRSSAWPLPIHRRWPNWESCTTTRAINHRPFSTTMRWCSNNLLTDAGKQFFIMSDRHQQTFNVSPHSPSGTRPATLTWSNGLAPTTSRRSSVRRPSSTLRGRHSYSKWPAGLPSLTEGLWVRCLPPGWFSLCSVSQAHPGQVEADGGELLQTERWEHFRLSSLFSLHRNKKQKKWSANKMD